MERKNFTLYLRTDGNGIIGTGHIMRCLSIAEAVQRDGGRAVFLVADADSETMVKQHGFDTVCLSSRWNDLEQEMEKLRALIRREQIPVLLVDSYYVTPHYLEALGHDTKLIYIDDLDAFSYPVALLIRYAIYSKKREDRVYPASLEGCRYVPLRGQFCALPRRAVSKGAARILVLTGGTDPYHVALGVAGHVAFAEKYRDLQFDLVCGRYHPDYEKLCCLAREHSGLSVHCNVEDMAKLMQEADIAITAGGTTVYELCACGTPSVCYILADNQIQNARAMAGEGLMLYGGDVRNEGWLEELLCQLDCLLADENLREDMAANMQQLVDGKGADRIAEAIRRL